MKEFGATTPQLENMAEWLQERNVESVAVESTGVWAQELKAHYWIAPHEVLEKYGFEVMLVNTRELARVPGRKKTDRVDCMWIQRLHSCGLLTGSFRPPEQVCMLRTLVRDKKTNVLSSSCTVGGRGKCAFNSCTGGCLNDLGKVRSAPEL